MNGGSCLKLFLIDWGGNELKARARSENDAPNKCSEKEIGKFDKKEFYVEINPTKPT